MIRKAIGIALVFALVSLAACSSGGGGGGGTSTAGGPADFNVKDAITEALKKEVPASWSGGAAGAALSKVDAIEIVEKGALVADGNYYPVKAKVKGALASGGAFEGEGQLLIFLDDFGNWKASPNKPQ